MEWAFLLIGLALVLPFGTHRLLLHSPLLSRVGSADSGAIIQRLLFYGFVLGVLLIALAGALEIIRSGTFDWKSVAMFALALSFASLLGWRSFPSASGLPAGRQSSPASDRDSRPLVAYLANRFEQQEALEQALCDWLELRREPVGRNLPFLCVTHGREHEHARFLERVCCHFLEKHCSELKEPVWREISFPHAVRHAGRLQQEMERELIDWDFHGRVGNPHRPVVVGFSLMADDWFDAKGDNAVTAFARYWQKHATPPAAPLLLFLSWQLDSHGPMRHPAADWFRAIGNEDDGSLDPTRFRDRFGLPGVILPELRPVTHRDTIRWANCHAGHPHREHLKQQIDEQFRSRNDEPMPMRDLGLWLDRLLTAPHP